MSRPRVHAIVPTWNEADLADELVAMLARVDPPLASVTFADGGSPDGTADRLRAAIKGRGSEAAHAVPMGVVYCPTRGRIAQERVALERLPRDAEAVFVLVHADNRVPSDLVRHIDEALTRGAVGGAFHVSYGRAERRFRVLERLGNGFADRFRMTGANHCPFARLDALDAVGGLRPDRAEEGYDLLRRLRRVGRVVIVPRAVVTSPRRLDAAFGRTVSLWTAGIAWTLLGRDAGRLERDWYRPLTAGNRRDGAGSPRRND